MEYIIFIIFGAVGLVILGFLLHYSIQSIKQARILADPLTLDRLKDHLDQVVAVHGRPEPEGRGGGPYDFPVLWYSQKYQEFRRSGKKSSWRTIDTKERGYDFHLHFPGGGRIYVICEPTELQGKERNIEKEGMFARSRIVHEWFPQLPSMTVMGLLTLSDEGGTLGADKKLGMIFSKVEPSSAARREYAKGYGGIAFLAALVIAVVVFLVAIA